MRILIANEPCAYRAGFFVDTLHVLRLRVEVDTAEPEDLDTEVEHLRPHSVVCSRAFAKAQLGLFTSMTLGPNGANRADIFTARELVTIANVGFDDLLAILDRTELLWRST